MLDLFNRTRSSNNINSVSDVGEEDTFHGLSNNLSTRTLFYHLGLQIIFLFNHLIIVLYLVLTHETLLECR